MVASRIIHVKHFEHQRQYIMLRIDQASPHAPGYPVLSPWIGNSRLLPNSASKWLSWILVSLFNLWKAISWIGKGYINALNKWILNRSGIGCNGRWLWADGDFPSKWLSPLQKRAKINAWPIWELCIYRCDAAGLQWEGCAEAEKTVLYCVFFPVCQSVIGHGKQLISSQ